MSDERPPLEAVPDQPEISQEEQDKLRLEVQLAESQEQEEMNAIVNKHLQNRVVQLRVEVNRLQAQVTELSSKSSGRKAPQDRKTPTKRAKKAPSTPGKQADS